MIPQVIHYCWFGRKPLTEMAERCLASWRKQMPHCQIKRWDEDNCDINAVPYTAEAYRLGKYAYVADYFRLWIIYHHGGIYLDTDVELIKPLDDMLARGAFMGQEQCDPGDKTPLQCAMGLGFACEPEHPFVGELLDFYAHSHYVTLTGRVSGTSVYYLNRLLADRPIERLPEGLLRCVGFTIYPWQYLCPLNYYTGQLTLCDQSHAIHHYAASWVKPRGSLLSRICQRLRNGIVRLTAQRR